MTTDRPAADPTADEGGDPACWAHLFLDEDDDAHADPDDTADDPRGALDPRDGAAPGDPGDRPLDPGRTSRVGPR